MLTFKLTHKKTLILLLGLVALLAPPIHAQTQAGGSIDEILVVGTDETLQGLVKATISVTIGDPVSDIKPEELKEQILGTGYFKDAKIEIRQDGTKNTLVITVTPNPTIKTITIKGSSFPQEALLRVFEQQFNVAPGVLVNNTRLEEARQALGTAYQQNGFPFSPEVKLETSDAGDNSINVVYTVNEAANVKKVTVVGATIVPTLEIEAAFKSMLDAGKFDAPTYFQVLRDIGTRYDREGYRYSGANPEQSKLNTETGELVITIRELKVVSVDATAIGVAPEKLSLQPGNLFNYNKLLDDLRTFSKGQDRQIGFKLEGVGEDGVVITITLEDNPTGEIKQIQIEGNTIVKTETLLAGLKQKIGDTYNQTIALEQDFPSIVDAYNQAGYLILEQPKVNYLDGVYSIGIKELKLMGYEVRWARNEKPVEDRIILRELPKPGGLFNLNELRKSLQAIRQTGLVTGIRPTFKVADPNKPEEVTLVLELDRERTLNIVPGFSYNTLSGASGSVSLTESNMFGQNHRLNFNVSGNPNDAGQWLSGSVSYEIPWLDFDFLDFAETRTTFSVFAFTNAAGANTIASTAAPTGFTFADNPLTPNIDESKLTPQPRKYTQRSSGFGINLGRAIGPNITLGLSFGVTWRNYYLETNSGLANAYYVPNDATASADMPKDNVTARITGTLTYSTKNSQEFPTSGLYSSATLGYGWGQENNTALGWTQGTATVRSYLGFGFDDKGEFGLGANRDMALAGRFSVGTILGTAPNTEFFSLGGAPSGREDFTVRGYNLDAYRGQVFYSGSLEYRYDFRFLTPVTSTVIGIVFLDFGNAWGGTQPSEGIHFGYGFGVQINVAIGPLQIPGLRFDYGFSPANPYGVFSFRLTLPF